MDGKLWASLGALIFAGVAVFGIRTGRFKLKEFTRAPYLQRKEAPIEFWIYTLLLIAAAGVLAYVAIFVA